MARKITRLVDAPVGAEPQYDVHIVPSPVAAKNGAAIVVHLGHGVCKRGGPG